MDTAPSLAELDTNDLEAGAIEIVLLIRERFPAGYWGGEAWWKMLLSAALLRMADTAEATLFLRPSGRDIDAMSLLRSLLEQVITFAWIMASPEERSVLWQEHARGQRLKAHNDLSRFGSPILTDEEANEDKGALELLDVASRAQQADEYWQSRVAGLHPAGSLSSFRGLYASVYRIGSRSVHGEATALDNYISEGNKPPYMVHAAIPDDRRRAYALVAPLLGVAAVLACRFMPMLDEGRIRSAVATATGRS
jgi:hypothetical protein